MSDVVPGECRSNDCHDEAIVYLWCRYVEASPHRRGPKTRQEWGGEFCHRHAMRALDLKILELPPGVRLVIEKLHWVRPQEVLNG